MKTVALWWLRQLGRLWCRMRGASLGDGCLIHGFPRIVCKSGAKVRLGREVTLNAAIWSNTHNDGRATVLFAGPGAELVMGDGSGLSSSRVIAMRRIEIGVDSLIGAGCLICDSDMHGIPLGSEHPAACQPIRIGKRVFVGAGCTILKGVSIGDGSVIGAGSVVAHDIPSGVLAAGVPARIIRHMES